MPFKGGKLQRVPTQPFGAAQMIRSVGHATNHMQEPGPKPGMDNQGLGVEHTCNKSK